MVKSVCDTRKHLKLLPGVETAGTAPDTVVSFMPPLPNSRQSSRVAQAFPGCGPVVAKRAASPAGFVRQLVGTNKPAPLSPGNLVSNRGKSLPAELPHATCLSTCPCRTLAFAPRPESRHLSSGFRTCPSHCARPGPGVRIFSHQPRTSSSEQMRSSPMTTIADRSARRI